MIVCNASADAGSVLDDVVADVDVGGAGVDGKDRCLSNVRVAVVAIERVSSVGMEGGSRQCAPGSMQGAAFRCGCFIVSLSLARTIAHALKRVH